MALLGVNIDHVATLRNVRGATFPDPVQAALLAEQYGADGITAHLREDRRHIRDEDIKALKAQIKTRLNMEMANTPEMVAIATELKPYMVTIVPERREELTTEGGLDVVTHLTSLKQTTLVLKQAGVLVSLFIDPDEAQILATHQVGATILEFHTGSYCEAFAAHGLGSAQCQAELNKLIEGAEYAEALRVEVNAGHGLNTDNVTPILAMPGLKELNIGHSIVAEAVFTGLGPAVKKMKELIS